MSGPVETQAARTALAWQRTGLGVLAVAALLARGAASSGPLLLVVPAAVVAVAGLVLLGAVGARRARASDLAARSDGDARAPREVRLATGLVVLTALCALAADLLQQTR